MNFYTMEYFTVLARERSFTKAAEKLHITQQSLSSHIASLEKELDCQLVIRRIPLGLTYAGEVFLQYAEKYCQTQMTLLREFNDISHNQKGLLRIGAASARGRSILPPVISKFQQDYPNIRIDLTEGSNDTLCQLLRQGELDLAIGDFPDNIPDICLRDFYLENTALYISRALFQSTYSEKALYYEEQFSAGDFSALKSCPLVLGGSEDIDGRIAITVLKNAGIKDPIIRAVSHNVGMLLSLCAHSIGACFCPENLAGTLLSDSQQAELLTFHLGNEAKKLIRFGFQSQSYQWSVIEAFMNCAKNKSPGLFPE